MTVSDLLRASNVRWANMLSAVRILLAVLWWRYADAVCWLMPKKTAVVFIHLPDICSDGMAVAMHLCLHCKPHSYLCFGASLQSNCMKFFWLFCLINTCQLFGFLHTSSDFTAALEDEVWDLILSSLPSVQLPLHQKCLAKHYRFHVYGRVVHPIEINQTPPEALFIQLSALLSIPFGMQPSPIKFGRKTSTDGRRHLV